MMNDEVQEEEVVLFFFFFPFEGVLWGLEIVG